MGFINAICPECKAETLFDKDGQVKEYSEVCTECGADVSYKLDICLISPEPKEANLFDFAYFQNGRPVTWAEVTTEDLRATIQNYPKSSSAVGARAEWLRRMGKPF